MKKRILTHVLALTAVLVIVLPIMQLGIPSSAEAVYGDWGYGCGTWDPDVSCAPYGWYYQEYYDPYFMVMCPACNPPVTCADLGQVGTYPSCTAAPVCSGNNGQGCSASGACGTNYGTYQCDGSCSVGAPAAPGGYGNGCTSPANSCGQTNSGSIGCSGACSASTPSDSGCPPATCSNGSAGPYPSCPLSPSCVPYQGSACSSSSSCGTNTGTYQCDGSCSVGAPSVPSNYGQSCTSSANSCGMTNTGTRTCSGTCSVSAPADSACTAPPGTCTSPTISSFTVSPTRVRAGTPTALTFTVGATGITTSCVITGPGVNQTVAASSCNASGSVTVPDVTITSQATYTLTCDTTSATSKTYVNVIPAFSPF